MEIIGLVVSILLIALAIWAFFKAIISFFKFVLFVCIVVILGLIGYNELKTNNVEIETAGLIENVKARFNRVTDVIKDNVEITTKPLPESNTETTVVNPDNTNSILESIKSIQAIANGTPQNAIESASQLFKTLPDTFKLSKNIFPFYPVIQNDGYVVSQGEHAGKYLVYFDSAQFTHSVCLRMGADSGLYSTKRFSQLDYLKEKPARLEIMGIFSYVGACNTKYFQIEIQK